MNTFFLIYNLNIKVKLLQPDLEIINSNLKNNLLQNRIKLRTIDSSLGLRIGENFMHRAILF